MNDPGRRAARGGALAIVACSLMSCRHGAVTTPGRSESAPVRTGTIIEARMEDGEFQHFRIDSVDHDPRDREGDVWLYGVSVLDSDAKTWRRYCTADVEGRSAAIPVAGSWRAQGDSQAATDAITFACTSGAIAKCIRLGYKPWKTHQGISLQPYHAACVRMVRADYCGDGRPHTVDGTWIDVWDDLGIRRRDERDGHPEVFEAAWSPSGAAYLNMPRWSDDVADIIKVCPEHLRDRTSRDRSLAPSEIRAHFPEALIFDARYVRSADRRTPGSGPH
jgi:hypothetical protein